MAWYYGGIRIFVQEEVGDNDQIIARLNPLAGGTIYHTFGWDILNKKLSAYVVGIDDLVALRLMTTSGVPFTLISPWSSTDYLLKHITTTTQNFNCQTLRQDLPEDSPVFLVDMELWHDP